MCHQNRAHKRWKSIANLSCQLGINKIAGAMDLANKNSNRVGARVRSQPHLSKASNSADFDSDHSCLCDIPLEKVSAFARLS
jgi:hypothetical protein